MKYLIKRHDEEEDCTTSQSFDNYNDAYDLLDEIYADLCCSDADYEDRPYYEIIEPKCLEKDDLSCIHCHRTASNGIKCLGMCVADNEY